MVWGFSYNTYSTYNTYNNTTKKECPERHSLIFDLQRGFLPAKNFVGGGKTRSPENLYGGGKPLLPRNCITRAILKLVAVRGSGAYSTYVSIPRTSQMPKEPC